jgi:MATE family multidrug resistance protein
MITVFYIGRKGDALLLASVGLGNMMVNVLAFAITQGMNGALEYYVSNAYGQRKYKECGQWLNRGKFVATLAFLPVMVMFLNAEWLLLKLGQDPQISKLAKSYLTLIIPGIWSQIMFDATKKFHSA